MTRFRRQIAVLAALALMASLLVAAPAVGDEHPEADYPATYVACPDVPSSGFEDVPANHANAGDIDCIAYYGITQGTSATTYSPLMSVTREHMALFLTRLATRVGIEMTSTPDDAGFTDIGDLSDKSQTAINQLADLGITVGTSATTYGPADSVTRGQMALFIARLMNLMTPAEDAGFTPENVADGNDEVLSPFTDLGSATKSAYDAINQLWELGVVSGISDTAYAPSSLITRASMAAFMTGVLNHSNARPAGLSIQVETAADFGMFGSDVVVSYRDDNFAPVEGVAIAIFSLPGGDDDLNEDGECPSGVDCGWSENSDPTDTDGNIIRSASVGDGEKETWYAWMGDEDNADFAADTANAVSVTISSTTDFGGIGVTSDADKNADGDITAADDPLIVDIDGDGSVTITVQLNVDDDDNPATDPVAVARSGVDIRVGYTRGGATVYLDDSTITTDDDGQATFVVEGPGSTEGDNSDSERADIVTFTVLDDEGDPVDPAISAMAHVTWQDDPDVATSAVVDLGAEYQVIDPDDGISFRVTINLYDQYGDPIGNDNGAQVSIDNTRIDVNGNGTADDDDNRPINRRGLATYSATIAAADLTAGSDETVSVTIVVDPLVENGPDPDDVTATATVTPVTLAADDSAAASGTVTAVYEDDNRFSIGGVVYSYDSDDTYLKDAVEISMSDFEDEAEGATVNVIVYNDDGASVFQIDTS